MKSRRKGVLGAGPRSCRTHVAVPSCRRPSFENRRLRSPAFVQTVVIASAAAARPTLDGH